VKNMSLGGSSPTTTAALNPNRKVIPIARSFIIQYYKMLSECPQELHKFYKEQSDFIHPIIGKDESSLEINVRGLEAIRERVSLLNLGGMKISFGGLDGLDAQPSENDCVLITCNGFITTEPNASPLAFAQTFVLAPQESTKKSYFVRNSVFRFINGGVAKNVTSPSTPPVTVAAAAAPEPVVSSKPAPVVLKETPQVTEATPSVAAAPSSTGAAEKPTAAKPPQAPQPVPDEASKEETKTVSSSVSSSEESPSAAEAPTEPVEKKPFSYASAVTIRGSPVAAAASATQKMSNSGGPGWSVAPSKKSEKSTEKNKDNSSEVKESSKSSTDGAQQGVKKELGPSLYLNKLNPSTTKEDILKVFSTYGKVGKIDLNSRGFAFVEYDNRQSVLDALSAHKENEAKHKLRGKLIEIQEKQGNKVNSSKAKGTQQANGKKKEKTAPVAVEAS